MQRSKYSKWFMICPLVLFTLSHVWAADVTPIDPLVVFLVRHGEKVDASRDPQLSASGKERAEKLARVLRDANIRHVHSSDFIRTRDTAAPIAGRLDLEVKLYDPNDLPMLVKKIRQIGGRHLVVGHGTSTPRAVELLGGTPGSEINEAAEYDRLYIVTVAASGEVTTVLMRYGSSFRRGG